MNFLAKVFQKKQDVKTSEKMQYQKKVLREKVLKHFDTMYFRDAEKAEQIAYSVGLTADECWQKFPKYKEFLDDLRKDCQINGK